MAKDSSGVAGGSNQEPEIVTVPATGLGAAYEQDKEDRCETQQPSTAQLIGELWGSHRLTPGETGN